MCFSNGDYGWTAEVQVNTSGCSPLQCKCYECRAIIAPYEWRVHIYQQEYEECQRCECEKLDDDDELCDELCDEHDYGETFEYVRCETCDKILRAIEAFEAREGCPVDERRPALCDLKDELNRWNRDDAPLYAAIAIEAYPELASVPWLLDALTMEA